MNSPLPQVSEEWGPYIHVSGVASLDPTVAASAALRAVLADKAIRQAESIIAAITQGEFKNLPAVVQSLDLETGGFVTHRILNMLSAFRRFLTESKHADVREKLAAVFRPMDAWVKGRYCVTSPALLVIQAILYSHCEWFREEVFEAYSAVRAFEELDTLGFPEDDRLFIAGIIAHQTLLRAAWSTDREKDPKEVLAFYRGDDDKVRFAKDKFEEKQRQDERQDKWEDQTVGWAIARTLFEFLKESGGSSDDKDGQQRAIPMRRRQLTAALVLHSLCLYCRHKKQVESELLGKIKKRALGFMDHLLATRSEQDPPEIGLAFFQYGRYVHQAQYDPHHPDKKTPTLLDGAKEKVKEYFNRNSLKNATFCFQRVSTKRAWVNVPWTDPPPFSDIGEEQEGIWKFVRQTVGVMSKCKLDSAEYLLRVLGLDLTQEDLKEVRNWSNSNSQKTSEPKPSTCEILGQLLRKVFALHIPKPDSDPYFPTPLVDQVLCQMRDVHPEEFTILHIISRGIGSSANVDSRSDRQFTVWLPNFTRDDKLLKEITKAKDNDVLIWKDKEADNFNPVFLIARYVTAMIIGHAVSYAPRNILLDYYSDDARENWGLIIDRALHENGSPAMQTYMTQLNCEPAIFRSSQGLATQSVTVKENDRMKINKSGKYILGIDIGGTSIKILRFKLDPKTLELENEVSLSKEEMECTQPQDPVGDFIEKLRAKYKKEKGIDPFHHCIAVGISLAAPVSKARGIPVAPSRPLNTYFGTESVIVNANPLSLHKVDLAKEIKAQCTDIKVVKVLNDGDADIRDSEDEISITTDEGITVELKAGTGIAVAVHRDGKPIDLNAETAKAVLNLWSKPQSTPYEERFQEGVMGERCSKKGLKRLTDNVLFNKATSPDLFENPGNVIGPLLNTALAGNIIKSVNIDNGHGKEVWVSEPAPSGTMREKYNHRLKYFEMKEFELEKLYMQAVRLNRLRHVARAERMLRDVLMTHQTSMDDKVINRLSSMKEASPESYSKLSDLQRFAVGCSWILGRWLADAIALVVDIFGAREIRLAGGPLSGATGIFVTASAEEALKTVYGFDLNVEWDPQRAGQLGIGHEPVGIHRVREVKRLQLVYPPEESGIGGPRGAAKAALDAWIVYKKQEQLQLCRDNVYKGEKPLYKQDFDALAVKKTALEGLEDKTVLVSEVEVYDMLAKEASALGLTRTLEGKFRKI